MPAEVAAAEAYWHNPYFKHGEHAEDRLLQSQLDRLTPKHDKDGKFARKTT